MTFIYFLLWNITGRATITVNNEVFSADSYIHSNGVFYRRLGISCIRWVVTNCTFAGDDK